MEQTERINITIETTVPVSPELAWEYWTNPAHITQWNQASEDWHSPWSENDLRVGGKFTTYRLMAEDAVARAAQVAGLPAEACPTRTLQLHACHSKLREVEVLHSLASGASIHSDTSCCSA